MVSAGETIFALSTPAGRSGIAVLRISGPAAGSAVEALSGRPLPPPRRATLTWLKDPEGGAPIDQGVVIWFPAPASFTGEDMAELQLHGGRAVVAGAVEALARRPGLVPAEPGAFTRRAFDNGRLDLSAVEGLADLIEAETEAQRHQALRQMAGHLAQLTESWRSRLLPALAHIEAAIDFPDEDLPASITREAAAAIAEVAGEIAGQLADRGRGERLRDGLQIAILGPPNSGKSSLLNALARRDAAIVSEAAGTTRDVVEVHLDLGGYPVTLADTAGLRTLDHRDGGAARGDEVEAEGMRRARARAAAADLKLVVFDLTSWPDLDSEALELVDDRALVLLNKRDLAPEGTTGAELKGRPALALSAATGEGLGALLDRLQEIVGETLGVSGAAPAITRARHRQALQDCHDALQRSTLAALPELAAEDLRLALRALGRITGQVDVEDLLDVIFRDFCIGK